MKSLYIKFVVVTIGIMLFSSVLAFALSNVYYQHNLKPENDAKITKIAESITSFAESHPEIGLKDYLDQTSSIGYQIYLVNNEGKETFFGAAYRETDISVSVVDSVLEGETYHGILHFPSKLFVTGFFANELTNTIGVALEHNGENYAIFIRPDIKLLFNEMHFLMAWMLILTIIFSMLLVVFSTKYLINPIRKLKEATNVVAKGQYTIKLNTSRNDELGDLAKSFSDMALKLLRTDEQRKEFIANVSHDIQSPLSNIKGYTDLLTKPSLSLAERQQYSAVISQEINRLSSLTKQLLLLSTLDQGSSILTKKRFALDEQIKQVIQNVQWSIQEKRIMLSYDLERVELYADPSLMYNVWDNLISNAIKYNRINGSIEIVLRQFGDYIQVYVKDSGIGMTEGEMVRIFDRFYRADSSRTRSIAGTGLGMSIVGSVISLHKGKVWIKDSSKKGTTIIVELPLDKGNIPMQLDDERLARKSKENNNPNL